MMKTDKIFRLLPLWIASILLIPGCTKTESDSGMSGIPVKVACRLQIAALEGERTTRSNGALLNGEWTTEKENKVRDLTIIQFDGTDDGALPVIIRTFQNPDLTNDLEVGLMQPLDNIEREQTLYFIANAGETFSSFTGTLGELKSNQFSLTEEDITGGKMIMTGSQVSRIKTEIRISATLTRRLAKIAFTIDTSGLPVGSNLEVIWLQLLSVPTVSGLEIPAAGSTYPEASTNLYTNLYPVLDQPEKGYVWYVPENRRGTGSATTAADKNNHTPDAYCTCIYLEADYYPTANSKDNAQKLYYKLYPGKDIIKDFNLEGNKSYQVALKISGPDKASTDSRLTATAMPEALPGANCYMTPQGSTLNFNPYAAPGEDIGVTGFTYAGRLGTKESSKIQNIGIVWQTEIGLIKELYHLTQSGEIRLVTDDKPGNSLIAAYGADGSILWSWHIWITNYAVDNVNDNMDDNGTQETPNGHVYKWQGYIWMDRGIGAKNTTLTVDSYGMIYQWGRKDPFTPASETASKNGVATEMIPTFDANGNPVYPSGTKYTETGYIFDKVMNNPTVFFASSNSSVYDWYGTKTGAALWKYPAKTCFDPCPAGWCIPPATAINNVNGTYTTVAYNASSNIGQNRTYAKDVPDLFWSYIGYREQTAGKGYGAGHSGIYWTTNYSGAQIRIYGGFGSSYNGSNSWRYSRDGLGARCIKITN